MINQDVIKYMHIHVISILYYSNGWVVLSVCIVFLNYIVTKLDGEIELGLGFWGRVNKGVLGLRCVLGWSYDIS